VPIWKCYYHIIWATKHRQPLITSAMEPLLFRFVAQKCSDMRTQLIAINAMPEHIHMALSIAPTLSIPDIVKQLKGSSSHFLNDARQLDNPFRWQSGYSVHTVGGGGLAHLIKYIENQKEHHRYQTTIAALEETKEE
jgi:putative transposase